VRRKVSEVVRQRVELQADGVSVKRRHDGRRVHLMAFLPSLMQLAGAALVVEPDEFADFSEARTMTDAREEFTWCHSTLGDYPARRGPLAPVPETSYRGVGVMTVARPAARAKCERSGAWSI